VPVVLNSQSTFVPNGVGSTLEFLDVMNATALSFSAGEGVMLTDH
jgi:hypothetical protein